jgi:hypothetical protein
VARFIYRMTGVTPHAVEWFCASEVADGRHG